ncbi:hypothetical protein ACFPRL_29365 [Pseudoclavibacter helvolus]
MKPSDVTWTMLAFAAALLAEVLTLNAKNGSFQATVMAEPPTISGSRFGAEQPARTIALVATMAPTAITRDVLIGPPWGNMGL